MYFGQSLIKDEFLVSCILHECYMKAWANREKMQSLPHIYRFVRMNVRWQILRYIEKSRHSIYGQTSSLDQIEKAIVDFEDLVEEREAFEEEIRNLKTVTETIKYLSNESQQILSLYFQKGLTHKQIAERLGKTTFQISDQLSKSVKQIKSIIHVSKEKIINNSANGIKFGKEISDCQQSKVYELRKNYKLSFDEIATKLGLSQNEVHQHYIKAHQLLQSQSVQKSNNRF
ncbi:RNA polymerase sigma factor [Dyadobacter sp. CY356]|uniref:RNA polymerase sigma factor n=1 Tax=Dyadobacter sp. CY356 TaxID=2906442 RepID=UPI0021057D46|nr:sigma-70 family RNA polymerase sigma factor [Dyadobacter sp. CY356]